MAEAVEKAIQDAQPRGQDAGVVALIRRYAALIDDATMKATYGQWIRQVEAALDSDNQAAEDAIRRVKDALSAHSVASDLGPKLLAALSALGMAGAAMKGGAPGAAIARKLDEFSARRIGKHAS